MLCLCLGLKDPKIYSIWDERKGFVFKGEIMADKGIIKECREAFLL